MPKQPKNAKQKPPSEPKERIRLQSFADYMNFAEEVINGVWNDEIDPKKASSLGMLMGYGLNSVREANAGKLKMNVFLQDLKKVNVEVLSNEEMDRFLQGNEDTQVEVLQIMQERGGVVSADVEITPKREQKPKTDVVILGKTMGIEPEAVKDALAKEGERPVPKRPVHKWAPTINGDMRFCEKCGAERVSLTSDDAIAVCSETWGLE